VSTCFPRITELTDTLVVIRDHLIDGKLNATSGVITASAPGDPAALRKLITDELCLQRLSDRRLESLIATLAPGCVTGDTVLDVIESLIDAANSRVALKPGTIHKCPEVKLDVPPTTQSSLELFSDIRDRLIRTGVIRP
jgi:hypothetical protein